MTVSAAFNTALIGITRIAFNYILIKSSILCSASALTLLIFVEDRLESPSAAMYLYPETCLMSKSNNQIQTSYLVINIFGRSIPDLLS